MSSHDLGGIDGLGDDAVAEPAADENFGELYESTRQRVVLVVSGDPARATELSDVIEGAGWMALVAADDDHALRIFRAAPTDLILVAFRELSMGELGILERLRAEHDGGHVPIVCVLPGPSRTLLLESFNRHADDVVVGRLNAAELTARLRARIDRPPSPRNELSIDPITGAMTPAAFAVQLDRELERVSRGGHRGALGFLAIEELPAIEAEHGTRGRDEIVGQIVELIEQDSRTLDFVGFSHGVVGLLLPGTPKKGTQIRFNRLSKLIYAKEFAIAGGTTRLTPIIGYTESVPNLTPELITERAWTAMAIQAEQRDLHPTRWTAQMSGPTEHHSILQRIVSRLGTPLQVVLQQVVLLGTPLVAYLMLDRIGLDITRVVYFSILFALLITAFVIVAESRAAVKRFDPPEAPDGEPPLASALIAAYLPNEADTIVETVEAFLAHDYPNLQIILAYNTPRRLEVEKELQAIAERDPRFEPLLVEGSVSKAQNVNAALAHVRGEFVGLFDADHHPAPGSFARAWQWIASGTGVVQGHCVIRNGATNFVTRLVAAEFEIIYAVSHPGRARLHGFGVFGGSNGYWRTSLLRTTRMQGFMLTEDIDSSMRLLHEGGTIVSDPHLVSTELAPDTAKALWNQRLRWAQGWSQVSLRHLAKLLRSAPGFRQRAGLFYLLGWREFYPWVSMQMLPLVVFWTIHQKHELDWFIPIFVVTSILTFSAGPAQAWYGWRLSHESIGRHRSWFMLFFISSLLFYTEIKNVIARTAQVKEVMRDRQWKVTPRSSQPAATPPPVPVGIGSEAEADIAAKLAQGHTRRSTDTIPDPDEQAEDAPISVRSS